jgi:hypothetical protein
MQHGQIGVSPFLPAGEDAPKTIHPTVGTLHDPAPGFESRCVLDRLGFFAPRPDVRGESEFLDDLPHLIVVVAFIQTQSLRLFRSRLGPLDLERLQSAPDQLHVVAVGPLDHHGQRQPRASVSRLRLTPCLPRSVGFGPVFLSQPGALWSWRRPSPARPSRCP